MPDLENLKDVIAEKLGENEGEALHSSVDMTYA